MPVSTAECCPDLLVMRLPIYAVTPKGLLDARPDVPFRNEAEGDKRHSVADKKVDLIARQRHLVSP